MQKLLAVVVLALFIISSCKKEEEAPQPAPWNNDWFLFKATLINFSGDTSSVAFSSNQGVSCMPDSWIVTSIWPWDDRAYYRSELNGVSTIKIDRGSLFFESTGFEDLPDDSAFIDFFRSGYYELSEFLDSGFNIVYVDPDGWQYSASEYFEQTIGTYTYNFRIGDYHPFTRNGVQYVKVKIYFDGVYLYGGPNGSVLKMDDAEFEGYFRND
jgi:hypothetical protein